MATRQSITGSTRPGRPGSRQKKAGGGAKSESQAGGDLQEEVGPGAHLLVQLVHLALDAPQGALVVRDIQVFVLAKQC